MKEKRNLTIYSISYVLIMYIYFLKNINIHYEEYKQKFAK